MIQRILYNHGMNFYGEIKMSIKEELLKFKIKNQSKSELEASKKAGFIKSSIDLENQVNEFIKWYYETMIKDFYSDGGRYQYPKRMRDLIEKIAVWYELRYPNDEINRLMYCYGKENAKMNDVMFKNNPYIKELLDENADTRYLDWPDFYNASVFLKSLSWEERRYFESPHYKDVVYLNPKTRAAHLHVTQDGKVEMAENISGYTHGVIHDEELQGLNIRKVMELFKEKNIELPKNNELEKAITNADNWISQKEGILNCAMYRIIERGGNRIGPRRAFLFAKEFRRNIDIPMMYAIDRSDPGLRLLINEYLKIGGSKDLKCYIDYFSKTSKNDPIATISIQDLILTQRNNAASFYTQEETDLHQRLVNALSSNINQEEIRKEKVRQLRLERKLEKSRRKLD